MKTLIIFMLLLFNACSPLRRAEKESARLEKYKQQLLSDCCFGRDFVDTTFDDTEAIRAAINSIPECGTGWSYMPSLRTSSLEIKADTCLPDSICKKLFKIFQKNWCEEMSMIMGDKNSSYSSINKWNDSTGCTIKETWKKRVKGKWIEISESEYAKIK